MTDADIEELTRAFALLSLHDDEAPFQVIANDSHHPLSFQGQAEDAEVHHQTSQLWRPAASFDNDGDITMRNQCSAATSSSLPPPSLAPSPPTPKAEPANSRTSNNVTRARRKSLSEALSFSRQFVRGNSVDYFVQTWEATLIEWVSLVRTTVVPPHIPVTQIDMESRVLVINQVIAGKEDKLPSGFGYIQLLALLNTLEKRIRQARRDRLISTKPGRRDESQAIDMFLGAKDRVLNTRTPRTYVWKLKQAAERFSELTGQSPFLLIIFSRTAEIFVKNFHKVDNPTFKALAAEARKHIPKTLVDACRVLSEFTETILESGSPINVEVTGRIREEMERYFVAR